MVELNRAALLGTGAALGDRLLTSAELDTDQGLPVGTVARQSGVHSRYWCAQEDQISLGLKAARHALAQADVETRQLDAILHAAAVPYQAIPATAPLIQRGLDLGDRDLAAFDINATCLSFLAAVQQASAMIETGRWHHVLIVSSERASRGLDWSDPATAGLFGDGAGAAVLGPGPRGVGACALESHPGGYEASALVAGGTRLDHDADPQAFERHRRFVMDGRALYRLTRQHFQPFVTRVLASEGWTLDNVDCVIPHQASPRALDQMARVLGVRDRLIDISASHGNLISASLPVALNTALSDGRVAAGSKLLLLGTAAGVSFGAACVTL